jgi:integrase
MKMRRPHLIPLSPQAVEMLQELRKLTGKGQYIVSAPTKTGVISENTMLYPSAFVEDNVLHKRELDSRPTPYRGNGVFAI